MRRLLTIVATVFVLAIPAIAADSASDRIAKWKQDRLQTVGRTDTATTSTQQQTPKTTPTRGDSLGEATTTWSGFESASADAIGREATSGRTGAAGRDNGTRFWWGDLVPNPGSGSAGGSEDSQNEETEPADEWWSDASGWGWGRGGHDDDDDEGDHEGDESEEDEDEGDNEEDEEDDFEDEEDEGEEDESDEEDDVSPH